MGSCGMRGLCSLNSSVCDCDTCICDSPYSGAKCHLTPYWKEEPPTVTFGACGPGTKTTPYTCAYQYDNSSHAGPAPEEHCTSSKPQKSEPVDHPTVQKCSCVVLSDTPSATTSCKGILDDNATCRVECDGDSTPFGLLKCTQGMLSGNLECVNEEKMANKVEAVSGVLRITLSVHMNRTLVETAAKNTIAEWLGLDLDEVLILPVLQSRRRLDSRRRFETSVGPGLDSSTVINYVVLARTVTKQSIVAYLNSMRTDATRMKQLLSQALKTVDESFNPTMLAGIEMTEPEETSYFGTVPPLPVPVPVPRTPNDTSSTSSTTEFPKTREDLTLFIICLCVTIGLFLVLCGIYYLWQYKKEQKLAETTPLVSSLRYQIDDESLEEVIDMEPDFFGAPVQIDDEGTKFWVPLVDGVKTGYGKSLSSDNRVEFLGRFAGDEMHGLGRIRWSNDNGKEVSSYVGEFRKGQMHGHGSMMWENNWTYIGEFAEGMRSGRGRCEWTSRQWYDGEWVAGEMSGFGEHGQCLERMSTLGEFENGLLVNAIRHMRLSPDPKRNLGRVRALSMKPMFTANVHESSDAEIYLPLWGFTVANPKHFVASRQNGYLVITDIKHRGPLAYANDVTDGDDVIKFPKGEKTIIDVYSLIVSVDGITGVTEMVEKLNQKLSSTSGMRPLEMEVCSPPVRSVLRLGKHKLPTLPHVPLSAKRNEG